MKTTIYNLNSVRFALVLVMAAMFAIPSVTHAFVATTDLPFVTSNLVPNASTTGSFSVQNITDTAQPVVIQIVNTSGDFTLFADQIIYEISGDITKSGNLGDLTNLTQLSSLAVGATGNYTIKLILKSDAPQDTLMGKSFGFDIILGFQDGPTETISDNDGGGGGRRSNDEDDEEEGGAGGGNTTLDDETPSGPTPQVAGAFTGQGGGTGGSSDGEQGRVLGESTSTEEMATSTDEGSVVSKIIDKVFGDDGDEDDNCKYWWIFVIVWLIVSAVMYYFKGWGEGLISTLSTQLVFGILALLGLMSYFITGVACVIWPALIVGVGSAILLFINSNLRDDKVI